MKHLLLLAAVVLAGCTERTYLVKYRDVQTGAMGTGTVKPYYKIGDTVASWNDGVQIIEILDSNATSLKF